MTDKTLVERAVAVPLLERLRRVPNDARLEYEHDPCHHSLFPVGAMCHEAADTIKAQATHIEALEAALREAMSRCTDCGGRGSFVKRDEVTDRDLWESCASCAAGYAALEGSGNG